MKLNFSFKEFSLKHVAVLAIVLSVLLVVFADTGSSGLSRGVWAWALAEEKKVMSHYKETFISLNSTIPIVIDYVPVRVDKDGRTHFMADVYRQLTVARTGR